MSELLAARGQQPAVVRLDRGEQLPDPESLAIAVVLGSGGSVEDFGQRWVSAELAWLRRADRAGTPVLGIGFGAQALAMALGGGVERASRPQRGWFEVASSAPELIASGPWLAWREEVIRLPGEAELLAHDAIGPQAFRVGTHVGVQFHPEATPAIVSRWVASRSGEALDSQGLLEATSREFPAAAVRANRLLIGFIDSVVQPRR